MNVPSWSREFDSRHPLRSGAAASGDQGFDLVELITVRLELDV
jgi:hypothetical protein